MSATTLDSLYDWIWPRPGESSPSEEAGLTPSPPVYIATAPHVHIPLLDNDSNCMTVLDRLQNYRRLIHPSYLILLHQRHFFLVWQPPHLRPIHVQLLVREQVQAMQAGFISDYPEATWTGDRWVEDGAYIKLWGPGCGFSRSHLNDYRYTLEKATHELCILLRIEHKPRRTMIHSLRIQRLADVGTAEAQEEIRRLQWEYRRHTRRLANSANRQRRRQVTLDRTNGEYGQPLNEQRQHLRSELPQTIRDYRHSLAAGGFSALDADTPTIPMTQTPGLGSGGGVCRDHRTRDSSTMDGNQHRRGKREEPCWRSKFSGEGTPVISMTQTPGLGSGGGVREDHRTSDSSPTDGKPRFTSKKLEDPCWRTKVSDESTPVILATQTPGLGSGGGVGEDCRTRHPLRAALLARHITSLDSPLAAQDQMVTDRQNDASNPTVSHA